MNANWNREKVTEVYEQPFIKLLFSAQTIHQQHFNADEMELCTLLSIKTGACAEDCAYCTQSSHYQTDVQRENLLNTDVIVTQALLAKKSGSTRFCMGASWRDLPEKYMPTMLKTIQAVKAVGLETCACFGMLTAEQAQALKAAGLDYYNHNLDTSPDYYPNIITTHTYQDRLNTLEHVKNAGINVCCGGIIGLGESRTDRIDFLVQLANLSEPPASVPINRLIPMTGTPLEKTKKIDNVEFIRTIATARIIMPTSKIRLSAGRDDMSEEMHALCFMAGANSIFFGDTLLTAPNPAQEKDIDLLKKLGMCAKKQAEQHDTAGTS